MRSLVGRNPLLLILLAAFVLRAVAAIGVQHRLDQRGEEFLIAGDAKGYWELGNRLARGEEYAVHEPPRRVLRMPGFPLLLAGAVRLADLLGLEGQRFLVARLLLAGVGTLACWLVYRLGRELFHETVGLIAAGVTAVSPTMLGFSVLVLSETAFAAALTMSLLCMAKLVATGFAVESRRRGIWLSLLTGAAIALAVSVRPSWLLAGPLFSLAYFVLADNRRQAAMRGTLVLVGLLAALTPWAARNYVVTGHWVWTTLWVGPSLYDGLNPQATGDSDMTFFDRDRLPERLSEYDTDRHYRREAWRFAAEHPGRALWLAAVKGGRYWSPVPNAEQFSHWRMHAAVALFFVPMIVASVWATWALWRGFGGAVGEEEPGRGREGGEERGIDREREERRDRETGGKRDRETEGQGEGTAPTAGTEFRGLGTEGRDVTGTEYPVPSTQYPADDRQPTGQPRTGHNPSVSPSLRPSVPPSQGDSPPSPALPQGDSPPLQGGAGGGNRETIDVPTPQGHSTPPGPPLVRGEEKRARLWVWLLTAGPVLYFSAIHLVFVGSLRYRLPAEYPLWVLAAFGIWLLTRSRSR